MRNDRFFVYAPLRHHTVIPAACVRAAPVDVAPSFPSLSSATARNPCSGRVLFPTGGGTRTFAFCEGVQARRGERRQPAGANAVAPFPTGGRKGARLPLHPRPPRSPHLPRFCRSTAAESHPLATDACARTTATTTPFSHQKHPDQKLYHSSRRPCRHMQTNTASLLQARRRSTPMVPSSSLSRLSFAMPWSFSFGALTTARGAGTCG